MMASSPLDEVAPGLWQWTVGSGDAVMLGATPWDIQAARHAVIQTVAVLTGGSSEQELRDTGAVAVFDSLESLRSRLDETPLGVSDFPSCK